MPKGQRIDYKVMWKDCRADIDTTHCESFAEGKGCKNLTTCFDYKIAKGLITDEPKEEQHGTGSSNQA